MINRFRKFKGLILAATLIATIFTTALAAKQKDNVNLQTNLSYLNNWNHAQKIVPGQIIKCRLSKAYTTDEKEKMAVELIPLDNANPQSWIICGEAVEDEHSTRVYIRCNKMINKLKKSEVIIDAYVADEDHIEGAHGGLFGLVDRNSLANPKESRVFDVIFLSMTEL